MMNVNYDIYRYQFASGELELGGRPPLRPKVALETVMIEDYLREDRFVFTSAKSNLDYKHEYMWIPELDGVVSVFKFGYERNAGVDKSHWSLKKRMQFPHCTVVVSLTVSSPYILVWGYDNAFKSSAEVAEVLGNALNTSFKGRGISISMTLCDKNDPDAKDWLQHMLKVYKKAEKYKKITDKDLKSYEKKKKQTPPVDFRSCVCNPEKSDKIIALIKKYMKGKTKPQFIFMPLAAAYKAGVIVLSWPEIVREFKLSSSLRSSFFRLKQKDCNTYKNNSTFDRMVEEFRKM